MTLRLQLARYNAPKRAARSGVRRFNDVAGARTESDD
jgi:hypothetical protein